LPVAIRSVDYKQSVNQLGLSASEDAEIQRTVLREKTGGRLFLPIYDDGHQGSHGIYIRDFSFKRIAGSLNVSAAYLYLGPEFAIKLYFLCSVEELSPPWLSPMIQAGLKIAAITALSQNV
jgi:hypothetical protein